MKPTIESVIEKCQQYADSEKIWSKSWLWTPATQVTPDTKLRGLFRDTLEAARSMDPQSCFAAAENMGRDKSAINTGPTGMYSVRHLCTAIWYKAQGRMEDFERLLRIADADLTSKLLH